MNIDLGTHDYQPVDGYCAVPELPGLGQELSEQAMAGALAHECVTA